MKLYFYFFIFSLLAARTMFAMESMQPCITKKQLYSTFASKLQGIVDAATLKKLMGEYMRTFRQEVSFDDHDARYFTQKELEL